MHICKSSAANWFSRAYQSMCTTTLMETICDRHQNNVLPPFWRRALTNSNCCQWLSNTRDVSIIRSKAIQLWRLW